MKWLGLLIIAVVITGCTVRILTFGNEESTTDRKYGLGYTNIKEK